LTCADLSSEYNFVEQGELQDLIGIDLIAFAGDHRLVHLRLCLDRIDQATPCERVGLIVVRFELDVRVSKPELLDRISFNDAMIVWGILV
jgi:hypothetical protein